VVEGGLAGDTQVYDPAADRWSAAPGLPTPREHLGVAAAAGRGYVVTCVEVGDQGTREFLAAIIAEEERHVDWWETQLTTLEQLGEALYLAQQVRD
jgi:hypothetical protein